MNPSAEKAERARIGALNAIWNRSDSWRGPLLEFARISSVARSLVQPLSTEASDRAPERRLQFFSWEIETLIRTHRQSFANASDLLGFIFSEQLHFTIQNRPKNSEAFFDTILAKRCGTSTLIRALYAWIGELVAQNYGEQSDFSRVELVEGVPTGIVRIVPKPDRGELWLVDLSNAGVRVEKDQWIEWCQAGFEFKRMNWNTILVQAALELIQCLENSSEAVFESMTAQLFVLDQVICLQPSETGRWAERALLNSRRGDRDGALCDLKRFFAFHDRESAPPALIKLFDDLRAPPPH